MEVTTNVATSVANTAGSKSKVSSDFDTFLKMLTAQIQNQDPLNPIDSADYAVQLATFSSVEQQTLTNQKLDALTGLINLQGMAQLAPWVGQYARSVAPVFVQGAPVTLSPQPAAGADRAVLVVKDTNGTTVMREDIPVQNQPYRWAALDIAGNQLANGLYTFTLESYRGGEQISPSSAVESYALIEEVQASATGPQLVLSGGVTLSADSITALRIIP